MGGLTTPSLHKQVRRKILRVPFLHRRSLYDHPRQSCLYLADGAFHTQYRTV